MNYTTDHVVHQLPYHQAPILPIPPYSSQRNISGLSQVGLAVEEMKRHMTDEGWQIFAGLENAGYTLAGYELTTRSNQADHSVQNRNHMTNVPEILDFTNPHTVVVQDKREWDPQPGKDFRNPRYRFQNVSVLAQRPDIFKLTILKDAHQRPLYHRESAEEIGCHAWIIYYHPKIVKYVAPYVRQEHLIRTYHTVDQDKIPGYTAVNRKGCILSGAISRGVYPLRYSLVQYRDKLPQTYYLPHPGYHASGTSTPGFLHTLSKFMVSICTASIYGYALRKIIESTACGCRVITDLPTDEVLPRIDGNLIRVRPTITIHEMQAVIHNAIDHYNAEHQQWWANEAKLYYDYRVSGHRLVHSINKMRSEYTTG